MCVVGTVCDAFCTEMHYTLGYSTFTVVVVLQRSQDFFAILILSSYANYLTGLSLLGQDKINLMCFKLAYGKAELVAVIF